MSPRPVLPLPWLSALTLDALPSEYVLRALAAPFEHVVPPARSPESTITARVISATARGPQFALRLRTDPRDDSRCLVECPCGWWRDCPHGFALLTDLALSSPLRDALQNGRPVTPVTLTALGALRAEALTAARARQLAATWMPARAHTAWPALEYQLSVRVDATDAATLDPLHKGATSDAVLELRLRAPGARALLDPSEALRGTLLADDRRVLALFRPLGRGRKGLGASGAAAATALHLLRRRTVRNASGQGALTFSDVPVIPVIVATTLARDALALHADALPGDPGDPLRAASPALPTATVRALEVRWRTLDAALDVPARDTALFTGPHPYLWVPATESFHPVAADVDPASIERLQRMHSVELIAGHEGELYHAARRALRGTRVILPPPEAVGLPSRVAPAFVVRIEGRPLAVTVRLEAQYRHGSYAIAPVVPANDAPDDPARDADAEHAALERMTAAGLVFDPARGAFVAEDDAAAAFWAEGVASLRVDREPALTLMVPDLLARVTVRRPVKMRVRLALVDGWIEADVRFLSDDVEATVAALRDALAHKRRWVVLRDGSLAQLALAAADLADETLEVLEHGAHGRLAAHQLGRALRWADTADARDVDPALEALRERLRSLALGPADLPADFRTELRPYQKQALAWLQFLRALGAGGVLADDMGLGKTVTALALLLVRRQRDGHAPSLVVCPASVEGNWVSEAQRFAPSLRVVRLRDGVRASDWERADLVVATYALLRRHAGALAQVPLRYAILDEAQNIKNVDAETTRAARGLSAEGRLCLTGTPVENRLLELWSLLEFCNPGMLGPRAGFETRFERAIAADPEGASAMRLRALVRPFVLRRTKREVLTELPPREDIVLTCDLPASQRAVYNTAAALLREQIAERVSRDGLSRAGFEVLTALLRLRQLACDPRLVDAGQPRESSGKRAVFLDLVRALVSEGRRALVFSQFVELLTLWRRDLDEEGIGYEYLDGSTVKRDAVVARFQEGSAPLFLISLKAGGTGLNLTAADTVIHCDPWWNPAVEDQASDRAHRIGQHRAVTVYKLLARGTVEDKIAQLKARKRALADAVVRDDAGAMRGLSDDDVRALLGEAPIEESADEAPESLDTVHARATGAHGALDVESVRAAAQRWIDRPGATRRTLAGEALVREAEVAALLRGRGVAVRAEAIERVWAVVQPREKSNAG